MRYVLAPSHGYYLGWCERMGWESGHDALHLSGPTQIAEQGGWQEGDEVVFLRGWERLPENMSKLRVLREAGAPLEALDPDRSP